MIYGDLDISVLKELPHGRLPVQTFAVTGKLRQRNQRHVQLLGDALEVARNLADLVLAVFDMAVRTHQLQIVDHNHIQPMLHFQPSAAGAKLRRRDAGRIVDIDIGGRQRAERRGQRNPVIVAQRAMANGLHGPRAHPRTEGASRADPSAFPARKPPSSCLPSSPHSRSGSCQSSSCPSRGARRQSPTRRRANRSAGYPNPQSPSAHHRCRPSARSAVRCADMYPVRTSAIMRQCASLVGGA